MAAFDTALFRELLAFRGIGLGAPLYASDTTASTNDDAMEAARSGAPHGATFVADAQTRGRGRRGARWISPPGENLLCSVLLRPALSLERAGTLTLAVGLAARDVAAARVTVPVLVKWPNDLVAGDKKLAGILLESQLQDGAVAAVVVGIGMNLATRAFPPELRELATSLALLGAEDVTRERVLADFLAALERRLVAHERSGLAAVLDELRAHDALLGRRVRVDRVEGVAGGIADDGALLVQTDDGREVRVTSGSVERV